MAPLRAILFIVLVAMVTTSSALPPCEAGVRSRNYGARIQSQPQANPSTREEKGSPEVDHLTSDDYFEPEFKNGKGTQSGDQKGLLRQEDVNHPDVTTFERESSSGLPLRERPGHNNPSRNPTGSRNEGEYGYNYQGGNGDVQIH